MLVKKEEEIQFKPYEELRICAREGCGGILKPTQRTYCSRQCQSKIKHKPRGKQKEAKTYPKWTCQCGAEIQLDFDIKKHPLRFYKIKEEHICQQQGQEKIKD